LQSVLDDGLHIEACGGWIELADWPKGVTLRRHGRVGHEETLLS